MQAIDLDHQDPLKEFRSRFTLPRSSLHEETIYLCSNSLGLPPTLTFKRMEEQLQRWATLGVTGWSQGTNHWSILIDTFLKKQLGTILGASADEVIVMNSLTINLHLLLVSFYRPTAKRFKILTDAPSFPSDLYAIKSQIEHHKLDPKEALIALKPRPGEDILRHEDIETILRAEGDSIALVFLNSINFLTGQALNMPLLTKRAQEMGCLVGFDVAHAAGNLPLHLTEWKVDFAVGCSYKYLCSGPGGPGLAYVHHSHFDEHLPRLTGWWGNNPATRFQMHLQPDFIPFGGASSWQVSTPSILALTPLIDSLQIISEAGMERIRQKGELQGAFLMELLDQLNSTRFEIISPRDPKQRGCQLSLRFHEGAKACLSRLLELGVICDFRPPEILRIAPAPLYNTYEEIAQFVDRLKQALEQ